MADNVAVTAGVGTTIAADEVTDVTLGTVKVQYVKLMDGTLDGTTKGTIGANGLKVDIGPAMQASGSAVPANVVMAGLSDGTNSQRWLTALAQGDGVNGNNTGCVMNYVYNGATFDRLRGDTTAGAWVQVKAAIPAGTNLIGKIQLGDGTTNLPILAANSGSPGAAAPALAVSVRDANSNGQATSTNSAPVVIASDQTIINKAVTTSSGVTDSRVDAAASTNATSLKASAGNIFSIDVFNVAAYDVFLKLYNKASAPTVGTDTPVWTIPIKSGTGFSRDFPRGRNFATGIAYAITKLQADTDTTAVVAHDVTGTIGWI